MTSPKPDSSFELFATTQLTELQRLLSFASALSMATQWRIAVVDAPIRVDEFDSMIEMQRLQSTAEGGCIHLTVT